MPTLRCPCGGDYCVECAECGEMPSDVEVVPTGALEALAALLASLDSMDGEAMIPYPTAMRLAADADVARAVIDQAKESTT